jgi:Xaa-Pro dipeptidase
MSAPWVNWPKELPRSDEERVAECKEYALLHDDKFFREMHSDIRVKAFAALSEAIPDSKGSAVILAGGTSEQFDYYDSDTSMCDFRQEAYFLYLFQLNLPDCFGVLDLERKESLLFVPEVSVSAARWNGEQFPKEHFVSKYGVTHCFWVSEMDAELQRRGISTLHVLYGQNSDSGSFTRTPVNFEGMSKYTVERDIVHSVLTELRVCKTELEIRLLRLAVLLSSQAHVYVMRHIRPGQVEQQLEALFKSWTSYFGGTRHSAYTCICGSGPHGSILHYGHAGRPNDRILKDGDSVLLDMGSEYSGYATDLTRSYPVNGHFTPDQRAVHEAVMDARQRVLDAMRPGVSWVDMHLLAEKAILEHLVRMGILTGSVEDMEAARVSSMFMPHGLGHLMGLHVHDVGGYSANAPPRPSQEGPCWLRTARVLSAGMVLTVEPGCYFSEPWIAHEMKTNPQKAQFVNKEVLSRFYKLGGCRLEDDVLVTENGVENLSHMLPTTVEEIESVVQEGRRLG